MRQGGLICIIIIIMPSLPPAWGCTTCGRSFGRKRTVRAVLNIVWYPVQIFDFSILDYSENIQIFEYTILIFEYLFQSKYIASCCVIMEHIISITAT